MAVITQEYAAEQRKLHESDAYGSRGFNWAYTVAGIAVIERCRSVLDYGCGKGTLGRTLRKSPTLKGSGVLEIIDYDPGVPEASRPPPPVDLVVAVDVLEHIEPECLNEVLDHICRLAQKFLFVAIAGLPAKRFLSDGRNAHLIVEDGLFWRPRFEGRGFSVRRVWMETVRPEWTALLQKG